MFAGEHWTRPASLEIGIWTFATLELNGPTTPTSGGIRDERRHVLGALLRVVHAVDRVVEDLPLQGVALDGAGGVGLLDGKERAVRAGPALARELPESGNEMPILSSLPLPPVPPQRADNDGCDGRSPHPDG